MIEHFLAGFGESFSLHRRLGSGPFSESYLVNARESVACHYLGILPARALPDTSSADLLLSSLKDFSSINPVFLQIGQAGVLPHGGFYFLSTELSSDTISIQEYFQSEALSPHQISQIGSVCCQALTSLHAVGKTHGGIVPACIIMSAGRIRVGDAGISTAVGRAKIDSHQSQLLETRYTSPEHVLSGHATPQSDIYSLGAVLYHLLTGKPPFGGRTTSALMASVLIDETVPHSLTRGQEPGHVASAILRAIEKDPADRWTSAQQFGAALARSSSTSGSQAAARGKAVKAGCLPSLLLSAAFLCAFPVIFLMHK